MTTFYPFVRSRSKAPSIIVILDGNQYTLTIIWNVAAQRYYVNCISMTGNLIFSVPLVESPQPMEVELLEWDLYNGRVVITTAAPHGFIIGSIIPIVIFNAVPSTYNGIGLVSVLDKSRLFYSMISDPGQATMMGAVEYLINMAKGYFQSTIIFRNDMFEVTP
jgi:hypothetical protein